MRREPARSSTVHDGLGVARKRAVRVLFFFLRTFCPNLFDSMANIELEQPLWKQRVYLDTSMRMLVGQCVLVALIKGTRCWRSPEWHGNFRGEFGRERRVVCKEAANNDQ